MIGRAEFEFANDVRAAMEERAPRTAWMMIAAIGLVLVFGFLWSQWATIEEITTGQGRVIPSTQTQVVQTLERGIVREIDVIPGKRFPPMGTCLICGPRTGGNYRCCT